MNKILIIGQSLSMKFPNSLPWQKGASSKRLWKWFGVDDYDELKNIAICKNINQFRNDYGIYSLIYDNNVNKVFLVGKTAQEMFPYKFKNGVSIVRIESLVFCAIPHPSGLNVSCNYKDKKIIKTIKEALR